MNRTDGGWHEPRCLLNRNNRLYVAFCRWPIFVPNETFYVVRLRSRPVYDLTKNAALRAPVFCQELLLCQKSFDLFPRQMHLLLYVVTVYKRFLRRISSLLY